MGCRLQLRLSSDDLLVQETNSGSLPIDACPNTRKRDVFCVNALEIGHLKYF